MNDLFESLARQALDFPSEITPIPQRNPSADPAALGFELFSASSDLSWAELHPAANSSANPVPRLLPSKPEEGRSFSHPQPSFHGPAVSPADDGLGRLDQAFHEGSLEDDPGSADTPRHDQHIPSVQPAAADAQHGFSIANSLPGADAHASLSEAAAGTTTHVSNDQYSSREPLAGARSVADEHFTFERQAESPDPQPTIECTESFYPPALIPPYRRPISAPVDAVQTRPDRHTHTPEGVRTETAPPPAVSSKRNLLQDEFHEPPAQSIERQPTVGVPGAPPIQSAIQPVGTADNEAWVPETQDRHTESAVSYPLSQEKAAYSEQRLAPALEQLQDGRTEPESHHTFAEGNAIAAAELSGGPHNQPAQRFGPQSQTAETEFADLSTFPASKDAAHSLRQPHRHQPIAAADKSILPDLADGDGTKPTEEFPLGSQAAQTVIGTAAISSVALPCIAHEPALPNRRQPIADDDKAAAHPLRAEQAPQLAQKFRLPAQPAHSAITNSQHTAYISDQTGQFQPAVADRPLSPGSQPHHALGFSPPYEIAPLAVFAPSERDRAQPLEGTDASAHAQSNQPATPTHRETMASSSRASTAFTAERDSEPEGSHPQTVNRPSAYLSDTFPQPLERAEQADAPTRTGLSATPAETRTGRPAESSLSENTVLHPIQQVRHAVDRHVTVHLPHVDEFPPLAGRSADSSSCVPTNKVPAAASASPNLSDPVTGELLVSEVSMVPDATIAPANRADVADATPPLTLGLVVTQTSQLPRQHVVKTLQNHSISSPPPNELHPATPHGSAASAARLSTPASEPSQPTPIRLREHSSYTQVPVAGDTALRRQAPSDTTSPQQTLRIRHAEVSRPDGNTASPPNLASPGGEPAGPLEASLHFRPTASSEPRPKTSNASLNRPPYLGATSEPDRNGTKQPTAPEIPHVSADQAAIAQATTPDLSANAGIRILLAEDTPATSMMPLPSRTPKPLASTESAAPKLQPDARDPIAKEIQKNRLPSGPAVADSHPAFSPDPLTPLSRDIEAQGTLLVGRHPEAPLLRQVFTGEQPGSPDAIAPAALLTTLPTSQETDYPAQRNTAATLGDTAAVIVPPAQQLRTADMTASPHLRSTQSSPAIPSALETTVFATNQARPVDPEDARTPSTVSNASSVRQSSAAIAQFAADYTSASESRLPGSLEELLANATPAPEAHPASTSYIAPTRALAPQLQSLSRHAAALPVSGATSDHPASPRVSLHEASRSSIAISVAMREGSTPGLSGAADRCDAAPHPARRTVILAVSPQHTHSTDAHTASVDTHAISASTSEAHSRTPTLPDPENSVPRTRAHPEAATPGKVLFAARHGEVRAPSSYFADEFASRTHTKAAHPLHPPTLHAPVVETTGRPADASSVTETTIVYAVSPLPPRHATLSVEGTSGLTPSPLVTSSPAEHSVAATAGSNRSFPPHPVEPQAWNSQQADPPHAPGDLSTSLLLAPEGIAVPQQAFREARLPRPTTIATHTIPPQIQRPAPSAQNASLTEMSSPHLNRDSFRRVSVSADAAAASLSPSHLSARDFPPSQLSPLVAAATYAPQPGTLSASSPASYTSSAVGLHPESPPPIIREEPRNSAHGLASARPNLAPETALGPSAPGLVVAAKLSSEKRRPLQSELDSFASANQLRTAIPARPFRYYSERFFSRRAEPVSTPQPPPVRIDISRIDIGFGPSAVDAPARSRATRAKPTLSLGQYLRRRSGGR
jgi:hypothetical protein